MSDAQNIVICVHQIIPCELQIYFTECIDLNFYHIFFIQVRSTSESLGVVFGCCVIHEMNCYWHYCKISNTLNSIWSFTVIGIYCKK